MANFFSDKTAQSTCKYNVRFECSVCTSAVIFFWGEGVVVEAFLALAPALHGERSSEE